jgi:TonB family protein
MAEVPLWDCSCTSCRKSVVIIYVECDVWHRLVAPSMRLTLLESDRSFFRTAECAFASILAHAALAWLAVGMTQGGRQLPTDEREARVFFLLPPDRVDVRARQSDVFHWGRPGGDFANGLNLTRPGEGRHVREPAFGSRALGNRKGARGELPFGPVPEFVPDTVFSVLEVDKIVERYEGSAAPVYPRDLLAIGAEGLVQMTYVVDTAGRVDMSTIEVVSSDDPRFTESVRTALGLMLFHPATRNGKTVRQLVAQQFRFKITPPTQVAKQVS